MTFTHSTTEAGLWTLPVSELFGPTLQGEGPHTGKPVTFVRLGRCNLACSWCDTPYTWDDTRYDLQRENPPTTVETILADRDTRRAPITVLSGGEPLMHQNRDAFAHLIEGLAERGQVHIETNGTIPAGEHTRRHVDHVTVSPKLDNNTIDPPGKRLKSAALDQFATLARSGQACFKFVATSVDDLTTVDRIVVDHQIPPHSVWIMPEGTRPDTVLTAARDLAQPTIDRGYNTSTRLHTLLWGDERKR